MSDLFWRSDEQMERLRPFFPTSYDKPGSTHRRVMSGIVFVNRNGVRCCDAPKDHRPYKTRYIRWKR